jgi:leucyl aminopeptidase (aminopeptidase T)
MQERPDNGAEPPEHVAAAMLASDVIVAPTSKSLSHTRARHAASQRSARVASMPRVSLDMLLRTMAADPHAVRRRARAAAAALSAGRKVRITSRPGTDVTFFIEGREGIADDGDLRAPGAFGNLPFGEGFIAPIEGKTHGRVVFDGAGAEGSEQFEVTIEEGYATELTGDAGRRFRERVAPYGRDALAVAELGVGTNDAARLSGNVLEDEKILGTIHVAFGDNHSFGGTVRVPSHQDFVVLEPTVVIDGTTVLDRGRLEL